MKISTDLRAGLSQEANPAFNKPQKLKANNHALKTSKKRNISSSDMSTALSQCLPTTPKLVKQADTNTYAPMKCGGDKATTTSHIDFNQRTDSFLVDDINYLNSGNQTNSNNSYYFANNLSPLNHRQLIVNNKNNFHQFVKEESIMLNGFSSSNGHPGKKYSAASSKQKFDDYFLDEAVDNRDAHGAGKPAKFTRNTSINNTGFSHNTSAASKDIYTKFPHETTSALINPNLSNTSGIALNSNCGSSKALRQTLKSVSLSPSPSSSSSSSTSVSSISNNNNAVLLNTIN